MPGLKYHKLDLHTHTPASKCYLHKDQTATQIVQAAIDKGLSAIAVTDHNTAEWIDAMKGAAKDKGLVIFPGVELSLEQGHIVALFDPGAKQKDVEGLLGGLDIKPGEFGRPETVCTKNVYEVVEKIHERGGLAILAHIDRTKGIFHDCRKFSENGKVSVPAPLSKLLNEVKYDAVECIDGVLPNGFDEAHQIKSKPCFYQSSDNPDPEQPTKHSMAGLGSLYSWFKLETIDLEGLRQCFSDSEVRIKLKNEFQEHPHPRLVSMKVGDCGFLRNQTFLFHEGLNSIVGGKGVGKSLAIEFLRFALGQPSSDPTILDDHLNKLVTRLERNNFVEVVYQIEDGTQYQIKRTFLGRVKPDDGHILQEDVQCGNLRTRMPFDGDIEVMFPILAYSQLEVIKIAENKSAQLELIDRFIDTREKEQAIQDTLTQLRGNDLKLNAAIQVQSKVDELEHEANTLKEQIEAIARTLDNPLFEQMNAVEEKQQALEDGQEFFENLLTTIDEWREEISEHSMPETEIKDTDLNKQRGIAEKTLRLIIEDLKNLASKVKTAQKDGNAIIKKCKPEYQRLEKEYKSLVKKLGGDREEKEHERKKLEGRERKLKKELQAARTVVGNLNELLQHRNELLDQLEKAHQDLYDIRKAKFEELTTLSDLKLKLDLLYASGREEYEKELNDLLRGGQNAPSTNDRRRIAMAVTPRRLVDLVLARDIEQLSNEANITLTWADRVINKLWSAEDFNQVLALQHDCFLADVPSIKYRKERDVYSELNELSIGQKCTALLIIALCDGTMPVIIDQPEDALDIVSVWEDVSKKLRRRKNSRQFILTTHNSSVAVASDSDQFIVLDGGASQGRIIHTGAIDTLKVREDIIHHLEGGNEPYRLRARKYNIKDMN